ncbi:AAA family ATPase [Geobacter sulfurreducens]|jgi:BioD-like phosphotransacetylase family protein|uniref:BioD and DRTGG domain protein n=1 Tax=Geobacter sulfurreducens (strain ATCC 51573 / DSM 12127 / PCA) TaxID=243231 RepID=Q74ES4_GEOSL|nr:AAA family ATPase [Geobacter sulfurreducens]AAR34215.1 BioD and DRTGG domain protein [Geobacter sulfurreducens PCA]ADI83728.1 BioD and DRTGG domain protein [Geobacter sulfurreducens KN400]AJY70624.1 cobyrinic acid a,c-diamide synthase [Geobacter sulfurreducens]QVW36129.1 AAA family ATPase [Geobacter sulfurreducens]UAC04942.1 AAA family ATPase [Geobacter sulfurreducens]
MSRKIFIAATGMNAGKTTISVSLMHLARKKYGRVGFIKAVGPKCQVFNGITVDKDAALMARIFGLGEDIAHMSPVVLGRGSTKKFIDGEIPALWPVERITEAVAALEKKNDFLIIEGSGHGGVGSVIGLNNARVAKITGAPVILVSGGGIGNVIDSVQLNLPLYRMEEVPVKALVVNKLLPEKRETSLSYLGRSFKPFGIEVIGAFDWSPVLANPTLNHISRLLEHPLRGDQTQGTRIVHHIQLGAASSQKVIDGLEQSTLLVVTSSRDELLVTISSLYHIPAYREKIAGLVIPGHAPVSAITQQILDGSNIPVIRIHETTADVFSAMKHHVSKISAEDTEKIELVKAQAEEILDFDHLDSLLD